MCLVPTTTHLPIPDDFFVASELATRTLLWGRGDTIWGDTIPTTDLDVIVGEMLDEAGVERCDDCGDTDDVRDVLGEFDPERWLLCRGCR